MAIQDDDRTRVCTMAKNDNIADQPGQGPDGMVPTSTDDGVIVWDAMGPDSWNLVRSGIRNHSHAPDIDNIADQPGQGPDGMVPGSTILAMLWGRSGTRSG